MTNKLLDRVFNEARVAFVPPPRIRTLDWAERTLIVPAGMSATPGPYRAQPYLKGIFDAIDDESIERVTILKPARIGMSLGLAALVLSKAANDPQMLGHLLPTDQDAREIVTGTIEPLAAASGLSGLLEPGEVIEAERNTMLVRRFPNGSYHALSARSQGSIRSRTFRTILCDEVDSYMPVDTTSPVELAIRRTMTFPPSGPNGRKIVLAGTPDEAETSLIIRSFIAGDQRHYECCCPDCSGLTEILFKEHIKWEHHDTPPYFLCPHCGSTVDEKWKQQMVANGGWRATQPTTNHASFRFNAFISDLHNAGWGILRDEFLRAKAEGPLSLKAFVTTVLAQGWNPPAEVDSGAAAARREGFTIDHMPEDIRFLLAGTDFADDRIETTITGWSKDGTCYVLAHSVIEGDIFNDDTMWAYKDLLETTWTHPYGGQIGISGALCDAGDGEMTQRVRDLVKGMRKQGFRNIFSSKGQGGQKEAIKRSKTEKGLMLVGMESNKGVIFAWLKSADGSLRFSKSLADEFFTQLAAEHKVTHKVGGMFVSRYERISHSKKNEALDCLVLNIALRAYFKLVPWDALELRLRGGTPSIIMAPEDINEGIPSATAAVRPWIDPPAERGGIINPPERDEFTDPSKTSPAIPQKPFGNWITRRPT